MSTHILFLTTNSEDFEYLRSYVEEKSDIKLKFKKSLKDIEKIVYNYPLLLLDLNSFSSDKIRTFNIIKGKYPNIPIICLDDTEDVDLIFRIIRMGAVDCIPRDVHRVCFIKAIYNILNPVTISLTENINSVQTYSLLLSKYQQHLEKVVKNRVENLQRANDILFELSKISNWIFQHSVTEDEIDYILNSFGTLLNVNRACVFRYYEKGKLCYYEKEFEWYDSDEPNYNLYNKIECYNEEGKSIKLNQSIKEGKPIYGLTREMNDGLDVFFEKQNTRSVACVPIFDSGGMIYGFLRFDDCKNDRYWTETEINALSNVSILIYIVIHKIYSRAVIEKIFSQNIKSEENVSKDLDKILGELKTLEMNINE